LPPTSATAIFLLAIGGTTKYFMRSELPQWRQKGLV